MKNHYLILLFIVFSTSQINAQSRSPFRSGYIRLGINTLGKSLDNNLSPYQNITDGRYGAGTGYVLEFGHVYYFKSTSVASTINYGLDWTILSFNYNKLDKWNNYAKAASKTAFIDGSTVAPAISSKLGPVISFNPVEKLVLDLRFQVAPTLRFFDFSYLEDDKNDNGRYFSFHNENGNSKEENDAENVKKRISFGIATSFGITVRRKAIGLSIDYISGKTNSSYEAYDGQTDYISGKQKIPVSNLQVKLSFTL